MPFILVKYFLNLHNNQLFMNFNLIILTIVFTSNFHFIFNAQELKFSKVNDVEGNTYKTVIFSDQEWMIEDLKTVHFNNNEELEIVQDPLTWSKMEHSAICKDSIFNNHYYNFYVIQDNRNICPIGWHISTHKDWDFFKSGLKNLEQTSKNEFNLLMEIFPSNKAGRRYENGVYLAQLMSSYWWLFDESGKAYFRTSSSFYTMEITEEIGKKNGLSIRCVKN